MIITLTLNPAVDQTIWVDRVRPATANRYRDSELHPAGKGVNVSRMVHRLGWPTVALGFLAGETGLLVRKALDDEGVEQRFHQVPGQTRINVMVIDLSNGDQTGFFGPGPTVSRGQLAGLEEELMPRLQAGRVLVLAGSLPPGVPQDVYASLIRAARERGVRTLLNTGGEPLRLGLKAQPEVVKATLTEVEGLLGRELPDVSSVVEAAREITGRGVAAVAITMGLRGTLALQDGRVWWAVPPPVARQIRVGMGDSLVAGLAVALARGEDLVAGLRLGTAAAAATALSPGSRLGNADQVASLLPRVQVQEVTEVAPPRAGEGMRQPPAARPAPARPAPQAAAPPAQDRGVLKRLLRFVGRRVATRALEPPKRPVGPRERLRYAMDIDGTITQAPRHFKRLMDALLAVGDYVLILTARQESTRPETEALLASLGIHYDELLMRPDDWPHSIADYKVQMVRERQLHLLMDDDPRNCWAVIQRTEALGGLMLPIRETPEEIGAAGEREVEAVPEMEPG